MHTALWSHVDTDSTIDLAGTLIPLDNDLNLLPLPFYQAGLSSQPAVPIVFLKRPSAKAMQAAGIVASWFGILSDLHPVRFPVTIGTIPSGNAVVIAEDASGIPPALNVDSVSGPTLAMRTNPKDPYAKVLVLAGNNGSDLMKAAMALALERNLPQGPQVSLTNLEMPSAALAGRCAALAEHRPGSRRRYGRRSGYGRSRRRRLATGCDVSAPAAGSVLRTGTPGAAASS